MKRFSYVSAAVAAALLMALPALAKSKDKVEHASFAFNGHDRVYYYQIPSAADATAPLPAVVLLHAQGGYSTDLTGVWHQLASQEKFIIIAPESLSNMIWDSKVDGPDYLHAVVAEVAKKHPIDQRRVYLFGESTGGVYATAVGLFDSQYWAATAVHDAKLDASNYSLFKYAQRKEPFALWLGDRDPNLKVDEAQNEKEAFTAAGFPFLLKVMVFSNGEYGGNYDQVNEGAWKFFQQNQLPGPGQTAAK